MAEKDDLVKLRLPTTMTVRWREAAQDSGVSLSEWLRNAADVACMKELDVPALRSELAGFRAELGRGAGNLLDQIAERLHVDAKAGKSPSAAEHERALVQAAADIAAMRSRLDRALKPLARRRP